MENKFVLDKGVGGGGGGDWSIPPFMLELIQPSPVIVLHCIQKNFASGPKLTSTAPPLFSRIARAVGSLLPLRTHIRPMARGGDPLSKREWIPALS